jgi:hypothetical protein
MNSQYNDAPPADFEPPVLGNQLDRSRISRPFDWYTWSVVALFVAFVIGLLIWWTQNNVASIEIEPAQPLVSIPPDHKHDFELVFRNTTDYPATIHGLTQC